MAEFFPILGSKTIKRVPWVLAEKCRQQAAANHSQTLERLAERGGLSPSEFWCAFHGHRWNHPSRPTETYAEAWLIDKAELAATRNIHSGFNACMHREHCQGLEAGLQRLRLAFIANGLRQFPDKSREALAAEADRIISGTAGTTGESNE